MKLHIECPRCKSNVDENCLEYITTDCGAGCGCMGFEFLLECENCGKELYSANGYGEFDLDEAIEDIQDIFSDEVKIKDQLNGFIVIETGHGG